MRGKKSQVGAVVLAVLAVSLCVAAFGGTGASGKTPGPKSSSALGHTTGGTGGQLVVGIPLSQGENLDPNYTTATSGELIRGMLLFDNLTKLTTTGGIEMDLATGFSHNATNTTWTIALRHGVKFTNGRPFTAADVIFTIDRVLTPPKGKADFGQAQLSFLKPGMVHAVGKYEVRFNLAKPYGPFPNVWSSEFLRIVPVGFNPQHPIGTGPFILKSYSLGQYDDFVPNKGYWAGAPKLSSLELRNFSDDNAEVNALVSGQINVIYSVPFDLAATLKSNPETKLLTSQAGLDLRIVLNTADKPFNNPLVIKALKLIANRPQMIATALDGYGRVGNDYIGGYGPCWNPKLPQTTQNIAEAKRLLAQAGVHHLSFPLSVADEQDGMVPAAEVYSQEAKAAGVDVKVDEVPLATQLAEYTHQPAVVDIWSDPYLEEVQLNLLPGGAANAGHWNNPQFNALAAKLYATSNSTQQCKLITQMKTIEHNSGPNIVWGWVDTLVGYRSDVHGLVKDATGYTLGRLNDVWVGN